HPKHTEGGDFRQATYRAVRQGLHSAESVLLEPVLEFTLSIPQENVGRAMTDIQKMSGEFSPPEQDGEISLIKGTAPASLLADYSREVTQYTRGKGSLRTAFHGYAPCHDAERVIAEIGYDADADTENSADSVFCAHGAGHTVKWDEVPRHMHLPSALPKKRAGEPDTFSAPLPTGAPAGRGGSRPDIFALDKELMQIFEKAYGPVKNREDPYDLHRPDRPCAPREPRDKTKPKYLGREYLLVDGYNVIYSWDELRRLSEKNMDAAREALLRLLCNYGGYKKCEVILVFDAYKVKGADREIDTVGGVSVVYTKEAETADTYIEITSHELAKDHRVRVVTSDGMEQIIIFGEGALRVSAEAFYAEMTQVMKEIREMIGG
ncbi:MAG: NYN domain-containing protein, partial [Clostridia bacterium]|nr:NYN domain-containing protein [Clostridia bacterium]